MRSQLPGSDESTLGRAFFFVCPAGFFFGLLDALDFAAVPFFLGSLSNAGFVGFKLAARSRCECGFSGAAPMFVITPATNSSGRCSEVETA